MTTFDNRLAQPLGQVDICPSLEPYSKEFRRAMHFECSKFEHRCFTDERARLADYNRVYSDATHMYCGA